MIKIELTVVDAPMFLPEMSAPSGGASIVPSLKQEHYESPLSADIVVSASW